eukprot:15342905-Ditylum_brightwellii.AAC.1
MSCWDKYCGYSLKHDVFKIYPKRDDNKDITFAQVNRPSALCKKRLQILQATTLGDLQNQTLVVPKVIDATCNDETDDSLESNMTLNV